MINPKRGEIWLINWSPARGSEQEGIRPSLILQSDKGNLNPNYNNTIVLTITTKGKNIPFHIRLEPNEINKLNKESFIKCEQILTVSKERLIKNIREINNKLFLEIEKQVKDILDFT